MRFRTSPLTKRARSVRCRGYSVTDIISLPYVPEHTGQPRGNLQTGTNGLCQ